MSFVTALALGATLAFGQFGFGITVFDPSVYAEAVTEVTKLVQQYNQLVQTYQMITSQYNQMLWMAKTLPGNLARFRAIPTPWFLSGATNTYGTTGGWIAAINTGSNAPAGYQHAAERLLPYGAALSNVPADQVDRLQKHYATIELTDGANQGGMETIGTLRSNAPEVEAAIQSLENDSLNSDPSYNTEIAVLNKINAANVIALRNGQDTNKVLVALAELQLLDAKRKRDAEVKAINTHIQLVGQGKTILTDQSSNWTAAMLDYRL
ncbi:MAG: type IV secretion system protein [Acidobacteriales bacterium]|nr:type IV secretion system protein [Terriglobales bacterium]